MLLLLACTALDTSPSADRTAAAAPNPAADTAADSASDTALDTAAAPLTGPCAAYAPAVGLGPVQDSSLDELSGLAGGKET